MTKWGWFVVALVGFISFGGCANKRFTVVDEATLKEACRSTEPVLFIDQGDRPGPMVGHFCVSGRSAAFIQADHHRLVIYEGGWMFTEPGDNFVVFPDGCISIIRQDGSIDQECSLPGGNMEVDPAGKPVLTF